MTISAMRKKFVVLGLAMCLVLSSFHEVSCQVDGSESESAMSSEETSSVSRTSREEYNALSSKETSTMSRSVEAESVSGDEVGQSSSSSDKVRRVLEEFNKQAGVSQFSESTDAVENGSEKQKQLEEMEQLIEKRRIEGTKIVAEEETRKSQSKLETSETQFQGGESGDGESDIYQIYYGDKGEKESEENAELISKVQQFESKANESTDGESGKYQIYYGDDKESASMEVTRRQRTKSNSGSGIMRSLEIEQSGMWTCINQDKNGVKEDDHIVIPKYDLDAIIKKESIDKGSSSKTSSLITSLTKIVDEHKKGLWSTNLKIGKTTSTETSEKVKKLKETLKKYRGMQVSELVARSDYEEILTMAARYEELSKPSVTYISRLTTYGAVIKEGLKASQRVQTVHQRVKIHEKLAMEKQEKVDAEFELVKAVAQKGDALHVKIFAMKKLVSELEAEKEEVDMEFQKIVANLSRVLEEASHVYEKYHVVVSEWKKEQASVEYSRETIEKAEVVWVQFLSAL